MYNGLEVRKAFQTPQLVVSNEVRAFSINFDAIISVSSRSIAAYTLAESIHFIGSIVNRYLMTLPTIP